MLLLSLLFSFYLLWRATSPLVLDNTKRKLKSTFYLKYCMVLSSYNVIVVFITFRIIQWILFCFDIAFCIECRFFHFFFEVFPSLDFDCQTFSRSN